MDPFIGEIRLLSSSQLPRGWALCQGQTLPISQNPALYQLIGTIYGGDGQSTFGLPDLRGRAVVGAGQLAGGGSYPLGQLAGQERVALATAEIPAHAHTLSGTLQAADAGQGADSNDPTGSYPSSPADSTLPFATGSPNAALNSAALGGQTANAGSGSGHENRQPVLGLNYCIALTGIYPVPS